jgi:hypothetical protein
MIFQNSIGHLQELRADSDLCKTRSAEIDFEPDLVFGVYETDHAAELRKAVNITYRQNRGAFQGVQYKINPIFFGYADENNMAFLQFLDLSGVFDN